MTTLQKIAVAATLAAAIGAVLFQTKQASAARAEAQNLRAEQASLFEQIGNLQTDLANMINRLANLFAENPRLKNNSNEMELLKLRGEVTRLRPLQDDVVALQKMLKQSSAGLAGWKTNELTDVGRASPIDALQTYIYSSQKFDPAKIQNSVVGNDTDPPDPDALQNFIKNENNHPGAIDEVAGYKILSQTWLAPDKVQVELEALFGNDGFGISAPFTLQNINGEWKLVVFNIRDKNGKFNHVGFRDESLPP